MEVSPGIAFRVRLKQQLVQIPQLVMRDAGPEMVGKVVAIIMRMDQEAMNPPLIGHRRLDDASSTRIAVLCGLADEPDDGKHHDKCRQPHAPRQQRYPRADNQGQQDN